MRHEIGDDQPTTTSGSSGEDDELLTLGEACEFVGGKKKPIHPSNFYRGIQRGDYHKPIHPTPGISRWLKRRLASELNRQIKGGE